MSGSGWTPSPKVGGEKFLFGRSSGFWCCDEELGFSREVADETLSHKLGLVSQDVNDIRAGVLAAKGQRFLLVACNVCNACFGPWNTHANFDSRKAGFSAWLSSSCSYSQWFLENLQELAHDRGILVPVGEASVKIFRVLE